MPDLAGPFDGPAFGQAPYYRDRGYLEPTGVYGPRAATAAAGDLGLTAAGFALTLALGRAHVRGAAYERTGTAWTYTVPANTATVGPRRDLVVLRRDLVAKTVTPQYVQGTAAANPADPVLTQVEDGIWEEALHRVQAPANSGTPLTVTDLRRFVDPDSGFRMPQILAVTYRSGFADYVGSFRPLRVVALPGRQCRLAGVTAPPAGNNGTLTAGTAYPVADCPPGYLPAMAESATAPLWTGTGGAWSWGTWAATVDGVLTFTPAATTNAQWNISGGGLQWER